MIHRSKIKQQFASRKSGHFFVLNKTLAKVMANTLFVDIPVRIGQQTMVMPETTKHSSANIINQIHS
jgi:hypothetical protein